MYSAWGKSFREEKPKKHPKTPSFSSNLLDEIMRSIDGDYEEKSTRKQHSSNGEEMGSFRRTYSRRRPSPLPHRESKLLQDNDSTFFSTSSSSSDSSSGNLSILSDSEFYSSGKSRPTRNCFAAPRLNKPKKSNIPSNPGRFQNPLYYEQSEYHVFDEYQNHQQRSKTEENLSKTKSSIYSSFQKKIKQPISPGFRLTSFMNSLFSNGNAKKTKNVSINRGSEPVIIERSCLSKSAPISTQKFDNGVKRTVKFYPVSVILDKDSRPCGHKSIPHSSKSNSAYVKSQIVEKNKKTEVGKRDDIKVYQKHNQNQKKEKILMEKNVRDKISSYEDEDKDDEDGDVASVSSSDLFEIDHLDFFGKNEFYEDLPVYETTHLDKNHAIFRGLNC